MFVGIGIPIPVLDVEMLKCLAVEDKDIWTVLEDYADRSGADATIRKVNYAELKSGSIMVNDKMVCTSPTTSLMKSKEIAQILKEWISSGEFTLTEPVMSFPENHALKSLKIRKVK